MSAAPMRNSSGRARERLFRRCARRFAPAVPGDDTRAATTWYEYILVHGSNAGFVTGGGWINSPAGAYPADPTLTGRANFGFVARYKKGQSTPDGQTEFQFQAGNLNFQSESYQWLVVSGAKAQFKGYGRVNNVSGYGFLLTATGGCR
jgi:hypothetical protein